MTHLVPQQLGGDQSHLLDDVLVGVEVEGEPGVVLLDDHSRRLLDGLGPDAAHPGGRFFCKVVVGLERGEDKEAATRRREAATVECRPPGFMK